MKFDAGRIRSSARQGTVALAAAMLAVLVGAPPSRAVTPEDLATLPHEALPALTADAFAATGSMLDARAEFGVLSQTGVTASSGRLGAPTTSAAIPVAITVDPAALPADLDAASDAAASAVHDALMAAHHGAPPAEARVRVRFESPSGRPIAGGGFEVSTAQVRTRVARVQSPNGGMVWLAGGRLAFAPVGRPVLDNARLTACGARLCLVTDSGSFRLPFDVDPLFVEVWDRTFDRETSAFYLSIDPTPAMLNLSTSAYFRCHRTDRLRETPNPRCPGFDVVTEGGISRSEIGRILFEADVLFKSAGLGFDVLSGHGPVPGVPVHDPSRPSSRLRQARAGGRFCRMFWSSNDQSIAVSGGDLVLSGDPVRANAEAMVVDRTGATPQLQPVPEGRWCRLPTIVARELNAIPPTAADPPAVARLRRVASLQNLLGWLRGVVSATAVDASARALIDQTRSAYAGPYAPAQTSGIRSRAHSYVQIDASDPAVYAVMVYTSESISDHALGEMRREACEAIGGVHDDGCLVEHPTAAVTLRWARAYLPIVTRQLGDVHRLPDVGTTGGLRSVAIGVADIGMSAHGGVLLRLNADSRAAIRGIRGETVAVLGDRIEAWSRGVRADSMLEYFSIDGVEEIFRIASAGEINILVRTRTGQMPRARHQARLGGGLGVEWSRTMMLGTAPSETCSVVWADATAPDCVQGVCYSSTCPSRIPSLARGHAIELRAAGPGRWLVTIHTGTSAAELTAAWASATAAPAGARIAVLAEFASAAAALGYEDHVAAAISESRADFASAGVDADVLGAFVHGAGDFDVGAALVEISIVDAAGYDALIDAIDEQACGSERAADVERALRLTRGRSRLRIAQELVRQCPGSAVAAHATIAIYEGQLLVDSLSTSPL